jgi:hypothetical protein
VTVTTPVPEPEFSYLISGFVVGSAELTLQGLTYSPGSAIHPGDPVGKVITWLWRTNRNEAALRTADFLAQLREHSPSANSTIHFEDLLAGLRFALPRDVEQSEADQLMDFLRAEVPGYYGASLI